MNITKYYPMIMKALYASPWLITPIAHTALVKAFESHLALGQTQMPGMPMEPDDDMPIMPDVPNIEDSIAVISVDGIIGKHLSMMESECGGVDLDNISAQLKAASEDENVTKIVMAFNTPGGTVTGVSELGQQINDITKTKEVIGFTDTLCCSAGMWLASQCSAFYCSPSSDVGSVGVYSIFMDASRAYEDAGVKVNAISAGKWKLTGADWRVMSDEERTMLQDDVDKIYTEFKAAVTAKRPVADEDLQGQCFNGVDAVTKGLSDGNINNMEQLLDYLSQDILTD